MPGNPKCRKVPPHDPNNGGDALEFALKRLKEAMADVKVIDRVMRGQEYFIGRCMAGVNEDAAVMSHARDIGEAVDRIWDEVSEAYVAVRRRSTRPMAKSSQKDKGGHVVYDKEIWSYSLTEECPLCGSLLLHGPRPSDWRCPYCNKPISCPAPALPNHP